MSSENELLPAFRLFTQPWWWYRELKVKFQFPSFDGSCIAGWAQEAEAFFEYCETIEVEQARIAIQHLVGAARKWYYSKFGDRIFYSWKSLFDEVWEEFGYDEFGVDFSHARMKERNMAEQWICETPPKPLLEETERQESGKENYHYTYLPFLEEPKPPDPTLNTPLFVVRNGIGDGKPVESSPEEPKAPDPPLSIAGDRHGVKRPDEPSPVESKPPDPAIPLSTHLNIAIERRMTESKVTREEKITMAGKQKKRNEATGGNPKATEEEMEKDAKESSGTDMLSDTQIRSSDGDVEGCEEAVWTGLTSVGYGIKLKSNQTNFELWADEIDGPKLQLTKGIMLILSSGEEPCGPKRKCMELERSNPMVENMTDWRGTSLIFIWVQLRLRYGIINELANGLSYQVTNGLILRLLYMGKRCPNWSFSLEPGEKESDETERQPRVEVEDGGSDNEPSAYGVQRADKKNLRCKGSLTLVCYRSMRVFSDVDWGPDGLSTLVPNGIKNEWLFNENLWFRSRLWNQEKKVKLHFLKFMELRASEMTLLVKPSSETSAAYQITISQRDENLEREGEEAGQGTLGKIDLFLHVFLGTGKEWNSTREDNSEFARCVSMNVLSQVRLYTQCCRYNKVFHELIILVNSMALEFCGGESDLLSEIFLATYGMFQWKLSGSIMKRLKYIAECMKSWDPDGISSIEKQNEEVKLEYEKLCQGDYTMASWLSSVKNMVVGCGSLLGSLSQVHIIEKMEFREHDGLDLNVFYKLDPGKTKVGYTWEPFQPVKNQFPLFDLRDKVKIEAGGNVRTLEWWNETHWTKDMMGSKEMLSWPKRKEGQDNADKIVIWHGVSNLEDKVKAQGQGIAQTRPILKQAYVRKRRPKKKTRSELPQ